MSTKSGFTLIEMLVASLLLGMLITILTMVFNSSAIAWRTGKAGVAEMSIARKEIAFVQHEADNLLPRVDNTRNKTGQVLGAWKPGERNLRERAVKAYDGSLSIPSWGNKENSDKSVKPWKKYDVQDLERNSGKSFTVGVWSRGPDGEWNTEDDITTWPEEVEL